MSCKEPYARELFTFNMCFKWRKLFCRKVRTKQETDDLMGPQGPSSKKLTPRGQFLPFGYSHDCAPLLAASSFESDWLNGHTDKKVRLKVTKLEYLWDNSKTGKKQTN